MPSQQEYLLETKNLGISFGGLKAVQNVNLRVKKGALYGLIGPNGAGKTTVFNMLTGVYKPTEGEFYIDGENLTGLSQAAVCKKGVARTFQNIRLFNNMSVIKNVLISLANHPEYKCNLLQSIFRTNRYYETEKAMRRSERNFRCVRASERAQRPLLFAALRQTEKAGNRARDRHAPEAVIA